MCSPLIILLGGCSLPTHSSPLSVAPPSTKPSADLQIQYQTHSLPQATVYSLQIPTQRFQVVPAVSDNVALLDSFARQHGAIAAINAGFFDPVNQKSTSYLTIEGTQVADPHNNKRLIDNPSLTPYLNQILNRSEFRHYHCGKTFRYAIALHNESPPNGCQLINALGGGPALLPEMAAIKEGFVDVAEGVVIRDAIGSNQMNARSAVGITSDGSILLVMVKQKPDPSTGSGMTLPDLAAFMKTRGAVQAMNLDGGSSASLYYQGKTLYGKVDEAGDSVKRPVKSVLLVHDREQ